MRDHSWRVMPPCSHERVLLRFWWAEARFVIVVAAFGDALLCFFSLESVPAGGLGCWWLSFWQQRVVDPGRCNTCFRLGWCFFFANNPLFFRRFRAVVPIPAEGWEYW